MPDAERERTCDILIMGSGAGGLSAAVTAKKGGLRNGYLQSAATLRELAGKVGVDADGLEQTVRQYNIGAVAGEDHELGQGSTACSRFLGDPEHNQIRRWHRSVRAPIMR